MLMAEEHGRLTSPRFLVTLPEPGGTMAGSTQARLEFEKLRRELRKADNDQRRADALDGIDRFLDKHLAAQGAHSPACRCEQCAPVTDRFMGELMCADDVASTEEWGGLST